MNLLTKIAVGGLLGVFMGTFISAPSYATTVLQGDSDNGSNAVQHVQLIEGDSVSTPPVPAQIASTADTEEILNTSDSSGVTQMVARYNRSLGSNQVRQISQSIHFLSNSYGLDPRLLTSLVAVESSFRPAAVSSSGAIGLGQLKPETAHWLGVQNPYNPVQNLAGVAKYLRYLLDRYNGNVRSALAAYFLGQGTVDRMGITSGAEYYISKISRVFRQF